MTSVESVTCFRSGLALASEPNPKEEKYSPPRKNPQRAYISGYSADLTLTVCNGLINQLLQRICRQNPAFATDLALYVGDVLRLMCFDAEKQSIDDVQTRLATFMCLYIESSAETCAEKNVVPMTQESLASAINASRIQTSRICAQLKADGIISIGRKRVEVLDLPALMAMRQ